MPLTFLPYMILFLTTPNMWQSFSSVSAISSNGQLEALLELVVRRHVVARNAKYDRAGLDELGVHVAELHGLGGTTRRVVLGVEIQHHGAALEGMRRELDTVGGECFKFRERFVQCRRHVGSRSSRRSIWCA